MPHQVISAAGAFKAQSGMALLYDKTLTAAAASIDVTGIPATYLHLRVYSFVRTTDAAARWLALRFNGDTGANYAWQELTNTASTPNGGEHLAANYVVPGTMPSSSAPADTFGGIVTDIPYYANTVGHKGIVSQYAARNGTGSGGATWVGNHVGFWTSTAAINQLTFLPDTGNLEIGSRITIYGIE